VVTLAHSSDTAIAAPRSTTRHHGEAPQGPSLNADGCPGQCQRPEGANQIAAVFADLGPKLGGHRDPAGGGERFSDLLGAVHRHACC